MPETLTITHLAPGGDGATATPPLYIPFTLPGETVRAERTGQSRATLIELLRPSPDRVSPPCPHFGTCGGCALQHWADAPYAAWKCDMLSRALQRAGFANPAIGALQRTPPETRRRMEFAAQRIDGGIALGLHAAHTLTVIPIQTCAVLHPALQTLLPPLRAVLSTMGGIRHKADIAANLADNGIDLLIRADAEATPTDRTRLAAFAAAHGVARITWAAKHATPATAAPETAAMVHPPVLHFAGVAVTPPPGAFLQASAAGEAAIVAAVLAGLPKLTNKSRVIELYAGIGTLSFPLATRARVLAYEGDAAAAAALRRAAGGTRIEAFTRDLTRQPLQAKEFAGAAAVVLDPPFTGAAAQMGPLAAAHIPTVILVSCNPAALARDAAVLHAAGYRLESATPIDQFLWSAQLEAVCVFRWGK